MSNPILRTRRARSSSLRTPQLENGQALALVAWDELQQCPNTITSSQATTLAKAFIARFRGGGKAPEPAAQ